MQTILRTEITTSDDTAELLHVNAERARREERAQIGRELHDGVLQTLAITALQLEAAIRGVERHPAQARELLAPVAEAIAAVQRELRRLAPPGTSA